MPDLTYERDGAEHHTNALSPAELDWLAQLADRHLTHGPGSRITQDDILDKLLRRGGILDTLARTKLHAPARPVRAVLFDKRDGVNWALGWHQDRTIAVNQKIDTPGFGPWSTKHGIRHVEPPFSIIENMVTLRAHLDAVGPDNAPLLIAPGSHLCGRVQVGSIDDLVAELGSATCLANPGDVWLYATAIVHASAAAVKPARRRVLQIDYTDAELPGTLEFLGI